MAKRIMLLSRGQDIICCNDAAAPGWKIGNVTDETTGGGRLPGGEAVSAIAAGGSDMRDISAPRYLAVCDVPDR